MKVYWSGFLVILSLSLSANLAAADNNFTGNWQSNWGPITLIQTQNKVSGTYAGTFSGTLSGTVEGNRFRFTWKQTNGQWGKGYFILAAPGNSFVGKWGRGNSETDGGDWNAHRK